MISRLLRRYSAIAALALAIAVPAAADPQDNFLSSLQKSYTVLTDPDISQRVKSQEVDALFKQAGAMCADNCDATLKTLRWLNDKAKSGEANKLFAMLPGEVGQQAKSVAPEQIEKAAQAIDKVLSKANPEKLRHQAETGLEVLRYVVSIEEKNLFNLTAKNPAVKDAAVAALKDDLAMFQKQGRAMVDLIDVARTIGKPGVEQAQLAVRLAKDLDDLGLFFLKFAQSLSNLNALPAPITEGLKSYQDDVKQMPAGEVERILTEDFGPKWREKFIGLELDKPLKSGTVAQTYKCRIKKLLGGTQEVIVKVQRPGLAKELDWNRKINRITLKSAEALVPEKHAWMVDIIGGSINGMEDAFGSELDFTNELENQERFRRELAFNKGIVVPKAFEDYSTKRVLTMEVIDGENIERLLERIGTGPESVPIRKKLFSNLVDTFSYQLITVGDAHADLHPGNILAQDDGTIGLIDWGQIFKSRGMVGEPSQLMFSLFTGSADGFSKHFLAMGRITDARKAEAFEEFVRGVFKKNGLSLWNMRQLMGAKRAEQTKGMLEAIKEIVPAAFQKFGFRASPQYIQFFRSAAPVSASLRKIAQGIPQEELIEIIKEKVLAFAPNSVVRKAGATALDAVDWTTAPVKSCAKGVVRFVKRWMPGGGGG